MPELPEVETVMKGLEKTIKGQIISNVLINRPNLRWPFPSRMKVRLEGKLISNITRRSKYIFSFSWLDSPPSCKSRSNKRGQYK